MTQCLRAHTTLIDNLNSVPGTNAGWLTNEYNSISRKTPDLGRAGGGGVLVVGGREGPTVHYMVVRNEDQRW